MAQATDAQMQQYANERIRPRAEQLRALFNACADDKAANDDVYARAISASRWNDARTDGPPRLLQSGNSANPDDMTNYNAALDLIAKFKAGTFASLAEANSFATMWAVILKACVRPAGS
jgi:hypothetical protein